ncbi:hypothetical protein K0M31_014261 [Melipona bicolor]|uniref:Uncharacterized protein n=1 Tax=Melipona bicolor TaxID=60889 RepID=A0AA40G878_9HYME|nr:hypothetical protein K0M31_014261 [Melipona bicolor]
MKERSGSAFGDGRNRKLRTRSSRVKRCPGTHTERTMPRQPQPQPRPRQPPPPRRAKSTKLVTRAAGPLPLAPGTAVRHGTTILFADTPRVRERTVSGANVSRM